MPIKLKYVATRDVKNDKFLLSLVIVICNLNYRYVSLVIIKTKTLLSLVISKYFVIIRKFKNFKLSFIFKKIEKKFSC